MPAVPQAPILEDCLRAFSEDAGKLTLARSGLEQVRRRLSSCRTDDELRMSIRLVLAVTQALRERGANEMDLDALLSVARSVIHRRGLDADALLPDTAQAQGARDWASKSSTAPSQVAAALSPATKVTLMQRSEVQPRPQK